MSNTVHSWKKLCIYIHIFRTFFSIMLYKYIFIHNSNYICTNPQFYFNQIPDRLYIVKKDIKRVFLVWYNTRKCSLHKRFHILLPFKVCLHHYLRQYRKRKGRNFSGKKSAHTRFCRLTHALLKRSLLKQHNKMRAFENAYMYLIRYDIKIE